MLLFSPTSTPSIKSSEQISPIISEFTFKVLRFCIMNPVITPKNKIPITINRTLFFSRMKFNSFNIKAVIAED